LSDAAIGLQKATGRKAQGFGLGIAGDIDSERGRVRFSPNLKEFSGFTFKSALRTRLRLPVVVDNDAKVAAWGAYVCEFKRRTLNMACITLGTGVGCGLILNGRLYRGSTGSAGELGHTCVEVDGSICSCGARGCLETYTGTSAILATACKLLAAPSGRKSLLRRWPADQLTPEILSKAAAAGDAVAKDVWRFVGYYLGTGISSLVYLLNLDDILFVGGVSKAGRLILDPVKEILRLRPFRTPSSHVRVRIGRTPDLGAVGAALLGLEE
jgi:glucokinase